MLDLKESKKQLDEIERVRMMAIGAPFSPRGLKAFMCAFLCLPCFLLYSFIPFHIPIVSMYLPIACGVVFAIVYIFSKAPKTWTEKIDDLLVDYQPINIASFERLKIATSKKGYLDYDDLAEWLTLENVAINKILKIKSSSKLRFISK